MDAGGLPDWVLANDASVASKRAAAAVAAGSEDIDWDKALAAIAAATAISVSPAVGAMWMQFIQLQKEFLETEERQELLQQRQQQQQQPAEEDMHSARGGQACRPTPCLLATRPPTARSSRCYTGVPGTRRHEDNNYTIPAGSRSSCLGVWGEPAKSKEVGQLLSVQLCITKNGSCPRSSMT